MLKTEVKYFYFCYTLGMIKKTTIATFRDGDYFGEYDWSGGIPLSLGEIITVIHNKREILYKLADKKTKLEDLGEDQKVTIEYFLEQA